MSGQREPAEDPTEEIEADDEWRFSIDEVGPDAEPETPETDPIEPESISAEHAAFVVLGVLLAVGVVLTAL